MRTDEVRSIPDFPADAVTFWHGSNGWVYTCDLNNNFYEITIRFSLPPSTKTVSWGQDATLAELDEFLKEYTPAVRAAVGKVRDNNIKRFDSFAGPHLPTVISGDSIALIGDASHRVPFPLSFSSFHICRPRANLYLFIYIQPFQERSVWRSPPKKKKKKKNLPCLIQN